MTMLPPHCYLRRCKHYLGIKRRDEDDESTERPVCSAFPAGIPDDISYGDDEHLEIDIRQENEAVYEMKKGGK